jgi:hypothetical protein
MMGVKHDDNKVKHGYTKDGYVPPPPAKIVPPPPQPPPPPKEK